MTPAASVSGLYFAHETARYLSVGRVGRDQVDDYARRKSIGLQEAERWLCPIWRMSHPDIRLGASGLGFQ